MSLPSKAKVVIIGGGIHGLSTAWKLSETYKNPGDIIVLEKALNDQRKKFIRPSKSFIEEFNKYIETLKNLSF